MAPQNGKAEVFLVKTPDRSVGIRSLLKKLDLNDYRGKNVALKPNFNSADPFPATTHIETLKILVEGLKEAQISSLTLGERSGMGITRKVLEKMGVLDLSKKLGFKVVVLDEQDANAWVKIDADGTHWSRGFYIAKMFLEADKVVQTCCLKTHRFGGHFTLSLKNSTGLVARRVTGDSHDYMSELHGSPDQRLMIAEINRYYDVDFVLMDAMKIFVSGGPEHGDTVEPKILLASRDRVAIDAVGVAILRSYGVTREVMAGNIFELEQIRRAAELGVGVKSAEQIKLTPLNDKSIEAANKIENILKIE